LPKVGFGCYRAIWPSRNPNLRLCIHPMPKGR